MPSNRSISFTIAESLSLKILYLVVLNVEKSEHPRNQHTELLIMYSELV